MNPVENTSRGAPGPEEGPEERPALLPEEAALDRELKKGSAELLMKMSPAAREDVLRELFAPDGPGIPSPHLIQGC